MIITPGFRVQMCGIHSQQDCYLLVFRDSCHPQDCVSVFVIGSGKYKKTQPRNIIAKVTKCIIGFAVKNRFQHWSKQFPKREHWLD